MPVLPAGGCLQWQRDNIPFLSSKQGHISVQQGPDLTVTLACCLQCCNLLCFWRQDQQSSIPHKSERLFLLGIKNPIQHVSEAKLGFLYGYREAHVIVMEMSPLTFLPALFVASIDQRCTHIHAFLVQGGTKAATWCSVQALFLQASRPSGKHWEAAALIMFANSHRHLRLSLCFSSIRSNQLLLLDVYFWVSPACVHTHTHTHRHTHPHTQTDSRAHKIHRICIAGQN